MGSVRERMEASGFLKEEEMKNRTVCAPFLQHCSSRVLRGKCVRISTRNARGFSPFGSVSVAGSFSAYAYRLGVDGWFRYAGKGSLVKNRPCSGE